MVWLRPKGARLPDDVAEQIRTVLDTLLRQGDRMETKADAKSSARERVMGVVIAVLLVALGAALSK